MKMGNLRLEIWFGKVILVVLHLVCFGSCALLSQREFGKITDNGLIGADRIWIRPESVLVPGGSRSDLEVSPPTVNATVEADLLLEFRNGVTRDPLNVLSGWNNNNYSQYCNWTGVQCSSSSGQVIALNLTGRQLTGYISPLLGGLQFLQSLDLSNNLFMGSIPTSIANCSYLTVLNLAQNEVSGSIPSELGALSNLEELHLSDNALTSLPSSISNLSALRVLNVDQNQLQGDIMSVAWGVLGRLETLDLGYNEIFGDIPESLSNCSNLVSLSLGNNNLTGEILNMFETLQNLQVLDLSDNALKGAIPLSLGALRNLRELDLHANLLLGAIPVSLLNCSSLNALALYSNELEGNIPADIGRLSRLHFIHLGNNSLTGSIPASLANCTALSLIYLGYNSFSGQIPPFLGVLSSLESLFLQRNRFAGVIPASLGNCSSLNELILNNNLALSGVIPPELGQLKSMSILDLSSNFLSGQIPTFLGNSGALISLSLAKNQLNGVIPSSIGGLARLQGLNLSGNSLIGGIPPELSNCTELSELDLSGNFLAGNIPDELGNLLALSILYLNNNDLTGSISSAIRQQSPNLLQINLAYNSLSGEMAGYNFYGLRNLQLSLDLSHNLFTGPLPPGIGALRFVQNINFSFNGFSGAIPDSFSQCTGLEVLDLSSNNLDGQIPLSLTTLQLLTYFNVSFNQLSGSVPNQFDNFSDGSFLGNPSLCGPMLSNKCGSKCHGVHCHELWIILPAVAAGIAGALALVGIWFLFIAKMSDASGMVVPALPTASHFTNEFENLSMGDIVAATNGFSDGSIMGVGANSTVFAGVLPSGVMIAVKRLELRNDDRTTGKLYRGLQRLSKVEHPNLLKVHGLFSTGDLKVLVLEYMPNGSLRKQLYDGENCRLTWAQRLNIALGVAEAMVHLHHASSKPIIHQDLKPSNILLDSDMEPKVGDYGISSFLNHESHGDITISSNLYGTIGYIPPEYGALTSVSTMGDVYNFGVVLMELFTRKRPTDDTFGQEASLRSWVVDAFPSRIPQILDPTLRQELAKNEQDVGIHLMVRLAIACTRNVPKERPTMIQARDMLMEIKSIDLMDKSGPLTSQ